MGGRRAGRCRLRLRPAEGLFSFPGLSKVKKLQGDTKRQLQEAQELEAAAKRAAQELREVEALRDTAIGQALEVRVQVLREHKARHALMLRNDRLEAEVLRLRAAAEADSRAQRALRAKLDAERRAAAELAQQLCAAGLAARADLHAPGQSGAPGEAEAGRASPRRGLSGLGATGWGAAAGRDGGGVDARALGAATGGASQRSLLGLAVRGWSRSADGTWFKHGQDEAYSQSHPGQDEAYSQSHPGSRSDTETSAAAQCAPRPGSLSLEASEQAAQEPPFKKLKTEQKGRTEEIGDGAASEGAG